MESEKQMVEMNAEELKEYEAFKAKKAKKAAEEKKQEEIKNYKKLVDDIINETVPKARELNGVMNKMKNDVIDSFHTVIEMKEELYKGQKQLKTDRFTDSFTNSDGNARVTLGYYTNDNYDDTYTAGVDKVQQYIESLASDGNSRQLVDMVHTLLQERSKSGQLKAQNVLRLEKMANESGNSTFIEGMQIIRDAYKPIRTKQFVKVEVKNEKTNEWEPISLNISTC
ncbi:MAG: DUF3164 family protein [Paludibacteraceae bacterium]|nr:DUF3164 family protein [Paludibacteraceae bacterium]